MNQELLKSPKHEETGAWEGDPRGIRNKCLSMQRKDQESQSPVGAEEELQQQKKDHEKCMLTAEWGWGAGDKID